MVYKYIILVILLTFHTHLSFTQIKEKSSLAVVPFSYANTNTKKEAAYLTEVVEKAIFQSNRFDLVDRTNFEAIYKEMELQKELDFIEGKVVEQGKKVGAEYLLVGRLNSISAKKDYDMDKVFLGYAGHIQFSLKVIDVKTGKILGSELFDLKTQGGASFEEDAYQNQNKAIEAIIPYSQHFIKSFINYYFPVSAKVVEVEKSKKEQAKTIVIAGGSGIGLKKGDKLKIAQIQEIEIDGKIVKRNKVIGEVRVLEIEDANFSICKVTDGSSEIYQKLKLGKKLQANTKTKKIINKNYF